MWTKELLIRERKEGKFETQNALNSRGQEGKHLKGEEFNSINDMKIFNFQVRWPFMKMAIRTKTPVSQLPKTIRWSVSRISSFSFQNHFQNDHLFFFIHKLTRGLVSWLREWMGHSHIFTEWSYKNHRNDHRGWINLLPFYEWFHRKKFFLQKSEYSNQANAFQTFWSDLVKNFFGNFSWNLFIRGKKYSNTLRNFLNHEENP